jgi:hypothetical protein
MNNVLKHNDSKFCLIGKIKGLAIESKKARSRILKAKTERAVWNLADRKRVIGYDVRHHLLAYAFLRGETYHTLEKKCRPEHKPSAEAIFKIVCAHVPEYQVRNGKWTVEQVAQWMSAGSEV